MSGIDDLFTGMRISANGLTAERMRVDVIAENIANAHTTRTPEGGPYRRKLVVFQPLLRRALEGGDKQEGPQAPTIVPDLSAEFERIFEPGHPDADAEGMVAYPNINTVIEMADLITALRAYEANLTAQENFVRMAERALELAR